jgi:hypothetical protein
MRKKMNSSGLLVVVELGGEWPGLMRADVASRRVLSQSEGESPGQFAERVASSLDGLFGPGVKLTTVALACNERVDAAADSARRKLCSLSLGAMTGRRGSRLYLTASARSSGRLHHTLSSLAQDLAAEWRSAGLEVSVEFGEESRSSVNAAPAPSARVA